MRGAKKLIFVLTTALLSLLFGSQAVFAADTLTLTLSTNQLSVDLMPGEYGSADATITANTSNPHGYTIKIATNGNSADLEDVVEPTRVIPTFTLESGQTSIPFADLGDGYGISIDSGANFMPLPSPASNGKELWHTNTSGQNTYTLTFGVKPAAGTIGGTYENSFSIIAIINPSCPVDEICYEGNGDDGTGTMANQSAPSNSAVTLLSPNYSRTGYGFAGWNTASDGSGTNYGPNETISNVGDLSSEGLILYANWVASSGNLQGWTGCGAMNVNDVIALTDTRDGSTYAISKHPDGNCWMMENLRLDLSDTNLSIDSTNTNNPTTSFVTAVNNHPASTNNFCTNTNAACIDQVLFNNNNLNRNNTPSYDAQNNTSQWYSYGIYYNWYTATAGYGTYAFNVQGNVVGGDICPAGWRLPTGYGIDADLSKLDIALGGNGANQSNVLAASQRWRAYPMNYIYSGEQRGNTGYNRYVSGSYNSSSVSTGERADNLWLQTTGVAMNHNTNPKNRGLPVRCLVIQTRPATSTIHYEANGGTGTMADDENVDFATAVAATLAFTKQYYVFDSWNTKADGTGTIVSDGGSVLNAVNALGLDDGDTLTLYAIWRPIYNIVYDENNASYGSMTAYTHDDVYDTTIQLVAPNLYKTGYGFAGWSPDSDAATKIANGQTVTMYGPNQIITANSAFVQDADSTNTITLYATWLAPAQGTSMQTFTTAECTAMSVGDIIALPDARDGNIYTVSKLKDNKCWMVENLRLDPSTANITATNTNSPTTDFLTGVVGSASTTTMCAVNTAACFDQVEFNTNNIDTSLSPSPTAYSNNNSWYSYGVYYNWYTATAGNGTYAKNSGSVTGDICPAGWRLPTGGSNNDYYNLNRAVGSNGLFKYPNNFVISGDYNTNATGGRGLYNRYWSATAKDTNTAYRLGATAGSVTPSNAYNKWDGFTVRCVAQ